MKSARVSILVLGSLVIASLVIASMPTSLAGRPGWVFPGGCCFYNGDTVRTVVPPKAAFPNEGRDNFYAIMGGVGGQKGVVAVAPGDRDYHGGHWAFYAVTWNVEPGDRYLLTSEEAVLAAASISDVTITRDATEDFLCPIQP